MQPAFTFRLKFGSIFEVLLHCIQPAFIFSPKYSPIFTLLLIWIPASFTFPWNTSPIFPCLHTGCHQPLPSWWKLGLYIPGTASVNSLVEASQCNQLYTLRGCWTSIGHSKVPPIFELVLSLHPSFSMPPSSSCCVDDSYSSFIGYYCDPPKPFTRYSYLFHTTTETDNRYICPAFNLPTVQPCQRWWTNGDSTHPVAKQELLLYLSLWYLPYSGWITTRLLHWFDSTINKVWQILSATIASQP